MSYKITCDVGGCTREAPVSIAGFPAGWRRLVVALEQKQKQPSVELDVDDEEHGRRRVVGRIGDAPQPILIERAAFICPDHQLPEVHFLSSSDELGLAL